MERCTDWLKRKQLKAILLDSHLDIVRLSLLPIYKDLKGLSLIVPSLQ